MACRIIRDDNNNITEVLTSNGKKSLLWAQLLNLTNENQYVAESLFTVHESEEFKKWFEGSPYVNTEEEGGEPKLLGNNYYQNKDGETWNALEIVDSKDEATRKRQLYQAKAKYNTGIGRVPGLTVDQVKDLSNYLFSKILETANSVEDLDKISLNTLPSILNTLASSYVEQDENKNFIVVDQGRFDIAYIAAFDIVDPPKEGGKPGIRKDSKIVEILESKLREAGIEIKRVESKDTQEQDRTSPINIKEKYLSSPRDTASTTVKLLLRGITDDNITDETLGQPSPILFSTTFKLIRKALKDIYPRRDKLDVYPEMLEKLEELTERYPYIQKLINKLESSEEYVKTRFAIGMTYEDATFTQTQYTKESKGVEYSISEPKAQTTEDAIENTWAENVKNKFYVYDGGIIRLNTNAANNAKNTYARLRALLDKRSPSSVDKRKELNKQIQKLFKETLNSIGVVLENDTINKYYNTRAKINNFVVSRFSNVFSKAIPNLIKNHKPSTEFTNKDLIVKDESSIRMLAKQDAEFKEEIQEDSVYMADGKTRWKAKDVSLLAQILDRIQNDENYLDALLQIPEYRNSVFLRYLKGKDPNKRKLEKLIFSTMKNRKTSQGSDYFTIQPPDDLADRITRFLTGYRTLLTPADSKTLYTIKGIPSYSSGVKVNLKENNYVFEYYNDNLLKVFRGYILDEFYRIRSDKQNKSNFLFPELEKENLLESGVDIDFVNKLYDSSGIPLPITKELLNNETINSIIKNKFESLVTSQIQEAVRYQLIAPNLSNKKLDVVSMKQSVGVTISDYVFNGLINNIESQIFTGHISKYKSVDDFFKRANIYTTSVNFMRISNKVNENYKSFVIQDIIFNSEDLKNIKGYTNINLADGITFVGPELTKQRLIGYGLFTPEVEAAYKRLMKGELLEGDILLLTPRKDTNRSVGHLTGLGNTATPYREKTAYFTLWPGLVNTVKLKSLYDEITRIEKRDKIGVSVSVESAIKVGVEDNEINKTINTEDEISDNVNLEEGDITGTIRSHLTFGEQQKVPSKGISNNTLGSQLKVISLSDIKDDDKIGNISGKEWKRQYQENEAKRSDKGAEEFYKKYGISGESREEFDRDIFYEKLIDIFKNQSYPDTLLLESLEQNINIDDNFAFRKKIINSIVNEFSKSSIMYTAKGASLVQTPSFGFQRIQDLDEADKSKIRWFKEQKLRPTRIENNKVILGDILIPYSYIENIPNYASLSNEELKAKIGKDVLSVIAYRIPTQYISSTDVVNIAGILPKESGDTAIIYPEITAKTGSDFDIDKLFMLVPHVEYNKKTDKLEIIDPNEDSIEGIDNKRIQLLKQLFESPSQYNRIIKSIDTAEIKEVAKAIIKLGKYDQEVKGIEIFSPQYQLGLKQRFAIGRTGVGIMANTIRDHVYSQLSNLQTDYIGIGNKLTIEGKDYTLLNSMERDENDNLISENLSALLNAFVDIAKDDYISLINFTKPVINVATLLIRAGVDIKWVLSYISQPALRDFALQSQIGKSPLINFKPRRDSKILETIPGRPSVQNIEDLVEVLNIKDLQRSIKGTLENPEEFDTFVMEYFKRIHSLGDKITEQMLATKFDANPPRDFLEIDMVDDQIKNISNEESLVGFDKKVNNPESMLGAYYKNLTDFYNIMTKEISDSPSYKIKELIEQQIGDLMTNYKTRDLIESSLYSYLYSKNFDSQGGERIKELLIDTPKNKSLMRQLNKLKKKYPQKILLQILSTSLAINDENNIRDASQIYMRATKTLPNDAKTVAAKEWQDFMESGSVDEQIFFRDLVEYAYYTSGFRRGLKTFYNLIPTSYLVENKFRIPNNTSTLPNGFEQVIQHEYQNGKLVPKMQLKNVEKLENISLNEAFMLKGTAVEIFGNRDYLSKEDTSGNLRLYKKAASKNLEFDFYYQIPTLGLKSQGAFRVVEYQFDVDDPVSIFNQNKVTLSEELEKLISAQSTRNIAEESKKDLDNEDNKCKL